ncbi:LTA synthase family protein [uncultured Prevotella sp.]|uniref:LTA synthase family protein n=1 Tax=uncultured Prevotella sp. TaxID=159272 RepID=UPI0026190A50|nr:LTA synthase family protein [uncultured Prevotella sp.]
MQNNKRFFLSAAWVLSLHVLTLVFLSLFRLVEYVALGSMVSDTSASVVPAFVRGVWFDNVIACYISVVPLALTLLPATMSLTFRRMRKATVWWYGVLGSVAFMASAANIPYFAYFFKNINSSIFEWFGYAGTTAGMVTGEKSYFLYIVMFFVCTALYVYIMVRLRRWFDRRIAQSGEKNEGLATFINTFNKAARTQQSWLRVASTHAMYFFLSAITICLCVFGIRGRTGYNPIKISQAYYCDDAFLNQLGINPAFNLLTSALDDMRKENRDLHLMPYPTAVSMARESLGITGKCDSMHVLRRYIDNPSSTANPKAQKKNVVVILMESMSASLLQTFGQPQRLTPTLDSLYNHSMAFSHCYSAGIHTNHGMTASLYSFPALMFRNLMKGTVTPRRDGIPTVLKQQGYHNMFFMTHEAQYDNMKAFFATNGYDDIYAQEDYPKEEVVNSFGVSDHFLFDYAFNKINNQAATGKPFFATLLTISNHPPYVIPEWFKPKTKEPETQIVEYADWAIGNFLSKARKQSWYNNTVFVILADHGKLVGKVSGELPESYNHIPLLIFGPGVENKRVDKLANQVDLMPTLMSLLGISYQYDGFGIDQTKDERPMVFYSADNQIVARSTTHCYIYEPKTNRAFCYNIKNDGQLQATQETSAFKPLKKYAFGMIQTAQFMLKKQ